MAATAAVPARFAPNPRRRAMIAKVHIVAKQAGMTEEDYRATMRRVTGKVSARDCSDAQLEALLAVFSEKGFSARAKPRKPGQPARADHPVARKARAMWISLGLLCAIEDPSEAALEAFAARQLGCAKMQWMNQTQADRLIEALKAMAERHGWEQSLAGLAKMHHVHALKRRLCEAILLKLKREALIPESYALGTAAWKLCRLSDPDQFTFETAELDAIANGLGRVLRAEGCPAVMAPIVRGRGQ